MMTSVPAPVPAPGPAAEPARISARVVLFLVLSILAHLAVPLALLTDHDAEQGAAGNSVASAALTSVSVSLLPPMLAPRAPAVSPAPTPEIPPLDVAAAKIDAGIAGPGLDASHHRAAASRQPVSGADGSPMVGAGATPYFNSGRLTRLPRPLDEVDLNVPEITDVAVDGERALTILVNADGTMGGAEWTDAAQEVQVYLQRVAERFRGVRFVPGEVDGVAVNSVFRIMIASEPTNVDSESDAVPPEVAIFLRETTGVIEAADID